MGADFIIYTVLFCILTQKETKILREISTYSYTVYYLVTQPLNEFMKFKL